MTTSTHVGVSLRITHKARTPDDISKMLARHPNNIGVKGERRGSAASRAIWPSNYWSADFDVGKTVAERVAAIAQFVGEHEEAMRSLLRTGGKADIYAFIGVEREEVGFTVDSGVLAILGRVGVDLGIDIFAPTPKAASKSRKLKPSAKASGRRKSP